MEMQTVLFDQEYTSYSLEWIFRFARAEAKHPEISRLLVCIQWAQYQKDAESCYDGSREWRWGLYEVDGVTYLVYSIWSSMALEA